jgi:hypothetical protein
MTAEPIFHITEGPRRDNKFWPKAKALTLLNFINLLSSHTAQDNKDSNCIIPGILVGDKRASTDVKQVDALIYDVDGLQSIEDAQKCLEKVDTYSLIYTSYNHKTSNSEIAGKKYVAWANKNGAQTPPSDEDMRRFLDENDKAHYTNVKSLGVEHISGGIFFKISHDPIDKFRVVIPLAKPIIMMGLSYNSTECSDIFKSIYHGVGHTLGLKYDNSCSDPARVYYLPACHAKNMAKAQVISVNTDYVYNEELRVMEFDGEPKLLDFDEYPRKTLAPKNNRSSSGYSSNAFDDKVVDIAGKEIKLKDWSHNHPDFDIEELLQTVLAEEDIRGDRTGKPGFHIKCPFEDNHTKPGGSGTYAVNGDANCAADDKLRYWNIYCTHDSCKSMVGDSSQRLYHLKELITQGEVSYNDLYRADETPDQQQNAVTIAEAAGFSDDFDPLALKAELKKKQVEEETAEREKEKEASLKVKGAEATYARDATLPPEQVYKEVIDDLRPNMTGSLIKLAVQRIRRASVTLTEERIAGDFARSVINADCVEKFLDEILLYYPGFSRKTALNVFKALMVKKKASTPLDEEFGVLSAARQTGAELTKALQVIADNNLMRYTEAHALYADFEKRLWENTYSKETAAALNALTERYAKIKNGANWTFLDKEMTERLNLPVFSSVQGLHTLYANKCIKVYEHDAKAKIKACKDVPIMSIWQKESSSITEFAGITFAPGTLAESVENKGKYNLWKTEGNPWGCERQTGDASTILNHILETWCNNDVKVFNWVCTYLADIFQNPGNKKQTALVLTGQQGTGKSLPLEFGLAMMLGKSYGSSASESDITGKFNSSLAGKLLWVAEEVLFAGNQKAYNLLKDRISRSEIDIENKGMDKYSIPSCTRFIFTSNQTHVVGLDSDDRRMVILEVNPKYVGNFSYFTKLREWLDNGGREIWLNWLLTFDPKTVNCRFDDLFQAISTESKRDQQAMSVNSSNQFFHELLTEGCISTIPLKDQVYKFKWALPDELVVSVSDFKMAFAEYLRYHDPSAFRYDKNKVSKLVKNYFGFHAKEMRRKIGGNSVNCYVIASRMQCLTHALKSQKISQEIYDAALSCHDEVVLDKVSDG